MDQYRFSLCTFTLQFRTKVRTCRLKNAADIHVFLQPEISSLNLNYFTSNDRANNFTSDSEKLIAASYSQQKL